MRHVAKSRGENGKLTLNMVGHSEKKSEYRADDTIPDTLRPREFTQLARFGASWVSCPALATLAANVRGTV